MRTSTLARSTAVRVFANGRDAAIARLLTCATYGSIVVPEALGDTSTIVLSELVSQGRAALQALAALDAPSEEDLAEGKRIAEVIKTTQGELNSRGAVTAGRRDELTSLLGETEVVAAIETPAAPVVEAPVVEAPAPAAPAVVTEIPAAAPAAEAAVTPPRASDVRGAGGGDEAPEPVKSNIALVAAPEAIGVAQGHTYDNLLAAAGGILARTAGYPTGPTSAGNHFKHGALKIARDFEPGLIASGYDADEQLEYAASLARVGGGDALVAGGGWGSPSETLYDFVELEASDGMYDIPEIQIVRGGVKFTRGPEFSAFRGRGFKQTEAQAIAGVAKTFYRLPDGPDFVEVRAGVTGLGVTAGLLQNKAYPEYVARVLRGLLVAHTHEVNADTLTAVAGGSTAVTVNFGSGAFAKLLSAVELQAVDVRRKHFLDDNAVLEIVLPAWAISVFRQDLAFQNGWNAARIPDSAITQHFVDRRVSVQWVKDWQDNALGGSTPATAWPGQVQFLIYPAGTWVRGLGEVLSIDTLYDSAGLAQNEYTGLFTEESMLTVKRGHESRVVTVPIKGDGSTAWQVEMKAPTV